MGGLRPSLGVGEADRDYVCAILVATCELTLSCVGQQGASLETKGATLSGVVVTRAVITDQCSRIEVGASRSGSRSGSRGHQRVWGHILDD